MITVPPTFTWLLIVGVLLAGLLLRKVLRSVLVIGGVVVLADALPLFEVPLA